MIVLILPIPQLWLMWPTMLLIGGLHFLQDRYNWPLVSKMEVAKQAGIWGPTLYVSYNNGYHILTNWLILWIMGTAAGVM
jgi:hypothetical protein